MKAEYSLVFSEIEIYMHNIKHTIVAYKEALGLYKDDEKLSPFGLSKAHLQRQIDFLQDSYQELDDVYNSLIDKEMSPVEWNNLWYMVSALFFGASTITPQTRAKFLKSLT